MKIEVWSYSEGDGYPKQRPPFFRRRWKAILLACIDLLFGAALFASIAGGRGDQPTFTEDSPYVYDGAHVLDSSVADTLTELNETLEARAGGAQLYIVTIDSLPTGQTIEDYSIEQAERIGSGNSKKDNGVLYTFVKGTRQDRLEVGYGLEDRLTDSTCTEILEAAHAYYRRGDIEAGVENLVQGVADTATFAGIRQSDEAKDACVKVPAWNALCSTLHNLNPALLNRLHDDIDLADEVCAAATYASSSESFATRIAERTDGFTKEDMDALLELPYGSKLFTGYGSTSLKALRMLRDAFEDTNIERLYDAEVATGLYDARAALAAKRNESDDGLLKPYSSYSPICTNPVVLRSCAQLRRIINSIIRHYGLPDTIRVEVANELKHTEHEKKIITSGNIFNRRTNEKAKDDIVQFFGLLDSAHVKGRDLEKVRLYNEQGGKDPYTGQGIDFGRMLTEKDYVEIDHVLPFSRSCDNSKTNKVLVLTKSNRDKANRTPYEWMTSGEPTAPNWDEFCIRMNVWAKDKDPKHYYSSKLAKLKEENFTNNLETFISRNLNDTRYMSKDVAKWLTDCLPFPDDGRRHVFCVTGAATGLMRRVWRIGILNEDGKKDRDDDRHHAVDAAVIAACTPSVVKSIALISEEHATHRDTDRLLNRSLPYPKYKDQVEAWIPCIVPTYSPTRTATGALFKENAYSYKGVDEKGKDLIKKKKGEAGPCTTAWKDGKGTARAYDGQYGLLAVYDEKSSRWLLDPLYYIDVQKRKNQEPFIRKFSKDLSIDYWEKIPLTGRERTLFIKCGDVLIQGGNVGRYFNYLVSSNSVYMYDTRGKIPFQKTGPLANEKFPTPTKWTSDLKIMQEDCLGLCWLEFLTDRTNNC